MKPLLRNLVAVAISCSVSVALAEVLLRLAGIAYPAYYIVDRERGYGLRPGAEGVWTREGRGQVRINGAGFRGPEVSRQPAPGVLRIAVLGDSFTEALQVDAAASWVGQLQSRLQRDPQCRLRQRFPAGVEVLNFGVGGYGTGQQWLTWQHLAREYRPALVLLALYPGNDFTDNEPIRRNDRPVFRIGPDGQLQRDDAFRSSTAYRWRSSLPGQVLDGLISHSRLLQLLNEAKNRAAAQRPSPATTPGSAPAAPPPPPLASGQAWAITEALLARLAADAAARGARLAVVSTSAPDQVWPRQDQRPADPFAQERRLATVLAARRIPYLPLGPALQRQADAQGLTLHGFARQAPGQGHWNPTGHRLAAAAIVPWLCGL